VPTPRRSQTERSRSTRASLIEAARSLFAERGYAAVPAEEIVQAAGVTRGALYHHFVDKQGLFCAVVAQLEAEITEEVAAVVRSAADPWTAGLAALTRFLEICRRPEVMQISLTDAPAVLGWQTWREIESRHGLGLITETLDAATAEGMLIPVPIPELAQLVLSACSEAALMIAHAEDAEDAEDAPAGSRSRPRVSADGRLPTILSDKGGRTRRHTADQRHGAADLTCATAPPDCCRREAAPAFRRLDLDVTSRGHQRSLDSTGLG
jgi:AcrR family transcriptional regulator